MKHQREESASNSKNGHQNASRPVPPAMLRENQPRATHAKSHAAHLEKGNEQPHNKPARDSRTISHPGARKQPDGRDGH